MKAVEVVLHTDGSPGQLHRAYLMILSLRRGLANPWSRLSIRAPENCRERISAFRADLSRALSVPPTPIDVVVSECLGDAGKTDYAVHCTPDFLCVNRLVVDEPFSIAGLPDGCRFDAAEPNGNRGRPIPWSSMERQLVLLRRVLQPNGQLNLAPVSHLLGDSLHEWFGLVRSAHSSQLFWNARYDANPGLGSGVGSRGVFIHIKRYLLNRYVTPYRPRVLDLGCGDLQVVSALEFEDYVGVDQSEQAIELASARRPDWRFVVGDIDSASVEPADVVLCFEVLIHVADRRHLRRLVRRLGDLTRKRIVVTGYDHPIPTGEIVFFHEPLGELLAQLPGFRAPILVAQYENLSVYTVDREDSNLPIAAPLTPVEYSTFLISLGNNAQSDLRALREALRGVSAEVVEAVRSRHTELGEAIRSGHSELGEAIRSGHSELGEAIRSGRSELENSIHSVESAQRHILKAETQRILMQQDELRTTLARLLELHLAVSDRLAHQQRQIDHLVALSELRLSRRVTRRLNRWLGRE